MPDTLLGTPDAVETPSRNEIRWERRFNGRRVRRIRPFEKEDPAFVEAAYNRARSGGNKRRTLTAGLALLHLRLRDNDPQSNGLSLYLRGLILYAQPWEPMQTAVALKGAGKPFYEEALAWTEAWLVLMDAEPALATCAPRLNYVLLKHQLMLIMGASQRDCRDVLRKAEMIALSWGANGGLLAESMLAAKARGMKDMGEFSPIAAKVWGTIKVAERFRGTEPGPELTLFEEALKEGLFF